MELLSTVAGQFASGFPIFSQFRGVRSRLAASIFNIINIMRQTQPKVEAHDDYVTSTTCSRPCWRCWHLSGNRFASGLFGCLRCGLMFGALLGFAGSLIGASSRARAQRRANEQNSVAGRVADAKRAGINPLVALGANLPAAQPVIGMGSAIESALNVATDAYTSRKKADADARLHKLEQDNLRLQNRVLRSRLENPRGRSIYDRRTGSQTAVSSSSGLANNGNYRSGSAVSNGNTVSDGNRSGDVRFRGSIKVAGQDLRQTTDFAPAEDIETEYGDVASAVYGLAKLGWDGYQTYLRDFQDPSKKIKTNENNARGRSVYYYGLPQSLRRLSDNAPHLKARAARYWKGFGARPQPRPSNLSSLGRYRPTPKVHAFPGGYRPRLNY